MAWPLEFSFRNCFFTLCKGVKRACLCTKPQCSHIIGPNHFWSCTWIFVQFDFPGIKWRIWKWSTAVSLHCINCRNLCFFRKLNLVSGLIIISKCETTLHTVKSRAVDWSTIFNFGTFWPKVHSSTYASNSSFISFWKSKNVLLTETCYCSRL